MSGQVGTISERIERARELYRTEKDLDYIARAVGLSRHVVFLAVNADKINRQALVEGFTQQQASFTSTNVRKRLTLEEVRRNAKMA